MKRGILILIFILLLAFSVNAMTVTLTASSDVSNGNSKDVVCKVAKNATEELVSLAVWFKNNESTQWHAGDSVTPPDDNSDETFSLTSLVNATYTWNCLAVNNESNAVFADSNNTFKVTFTTDEEVSETGFPWPIEINRRLLDWISCVCSSYLSEARV